MNGSGYNGNGGAGGGGGYNGFGGPPRFGQGGAMGRPSLGGFAFGNPDPHAAPMPGSGQPGRNPSPLQLATNRGKNVGAFQDPECPGHLISAISRWHNGKKVGRPGEAPIILEWQAMELIDMGPEGGIVHPWDYLDPSTDDTELANEAWDKVKWRVRMYDDGLPHTFQLKCHFALDGHQSWEGHDLLCQFPRENASFGATGAAQANALFRGGPMGRGGNLGHNMPHHAMQEIQAMELAFHVIREQTGMMLSVIREQGVTIQAHQNREIEIMSLTKELMFDKRRQDREELEFEMKMSALKMAFERTLPLLQHVGMKFTNVVYSKLMKKKAKSEREEKAFDFIKTLVKGLDANGVNDPEKVWLALKGMGIEDNEDTRNALTEVLIEVVTDISGEKAEKELEKTVGNTLMGRSSEPEMKQIPAAASPTTQAINGEK